MHARQAFDALIFENGVDSAAGATICVGNKNLFVFALVATNLLPQPTGYQLGPVVQTGIDALEMQVFPAIAAPQRLDFPSESAACNDQ